MRHFVIEYEYTSDAAKESVGHGGITSLRKRRPFK